MAKRKEKATMERVGGFAKRRQLPLRLEDDLLKRIEDKARSTTPPQSVNLLITKVLVKAFPADRDEAPAAARRKSGK